MPRLVRADDAGVRLEHRHRALRGRREHRKASHDLGCVDQLDGRARLLERALGPLRRPAKIRICHHVFKAKSTKHVTLRISRSAWPAHQRHGDSVGACTTASAKKFHSRKAHAKRFHHGRGRR